MRTVQSSIDKNRLLVIRARANEEWRGNSISEISMRFTVLVFFIFSALYSFSANAIQCPAGYVEGDNDCCDATGKCFHPDDLSANETMSTDFRDNKCEASAMVFCGNGQFMCPPCKEQGDDMRSANIRDSGPAGTGRDPASLACTSAIQRVDSTCRGDTLNGIMSGAVNLAANTGGSNTVEAQCRAMSRANWASSIGNVALIQACNSAQNSCKGACKGQELIDKVPAEERCKVGSYKTQMTMAGMQALMQMLSSGKAQQCAQATKAENCTGASIATDPNCRTQYCASALGSNDPACPQYCIVPGHQSHPACGQGIAGANCTSPSMANSLLCICQRNPNGPGCAQANQAANGTYNAGGVNANTGGALGDSGGLGGLQEEPTLRAATADPTGSGAGYGDPRQIPGGSGAGLGGGGGGGAPGSPGSYGNRGPASVGEKEVSVGVQNGGAVDPSLGTNAGIDSGADRIYGGRGSGSGDDGMKLPDFAKLFGGAAKAGRGPASTYDANLLKNGITPSNGLTNWEKVTRKLNQKAPTLVP